MHRLCALVLVSVTTAACGPPASSCSGLCVAPSLTTLDLIAGQPGGNGWVDGTGSAVQFGDPWALAGDGAGTLYLVDGSMIRTIDEASAAVTTLAGTFGVVGGLDGVGPAAQLYQPGGVALVGGTLYVCDTENHAIRAIDVATATVTTYAGALGQPGSNDGDRLSARFREPEGLSFDGAGSLYLTDVDNNTIRRIELASGAVTTVAGTAGVAGSADGMGALASFNKPTRVAVGSAGQLYIVDSLNDSIRVLDLASGNVTTLVTLSGAPLGIAVDGADLLAALADERIGRIDAAGNVTTLAGITDMPGFADGPAADARFFRPAGLWVEGGHVIVADDGNYAIRSVALADGAVTTILGAISTGATDGRGSDARFFAPAGLATAGGTVYVADTNNHTVRAVDLSSGEVTTLAGAAGQAAYADGSGADARFNTPVSIAAGEDGTHLYVADAGNRSIRDIEVQSGAVTTLPINGAPGSMFARFNAPAGLARDGGTLYVSDSADQVVVAVDLATNLVTNVAGTPRISGASDGTGSEARFNAPAGLAADGKGALYVADTLNDAVRKIDLASGRVTTVAGVLGIQGSDDGPALSAHFAQPSTLAVDGLGDLFVGDSLNALVRRVDLRAGTVSTAIGVLKQTGVRPGPLPAQLGQPTALALTVEGGLLVVSESSLLLAH